MRVWQTALAGKVPVTTIAAGPLLTALTVPVMSVQAPVPFSEYCNLNVPLVGEVST